MAGALVSLFVESLATMAKEKVATMAKEEVPMLLGVEDALRQLEEEMRAFSGVLQDAERRAFTDTSIRRWIADVKDLVYDADDIIDYSRTQAERMSTKEEPVLCYTPILLFFCKIVLRHWTGNSIRSVNVRLERIRKRESGLKLIATAAPPPYDHRGSISRIQRQTGPILLETNIVGSGIENDTSYLVGLLTREELGSQRIPLVAITGMGGVGKTTLAQKIYNHKAIKDSFREPPPMWVCVSQQYSIEKLLKEIITRCAIAGEGGPERDHESFAELQERLATVIKGKKFFLILDDVWAAKVWVDLLQIPLQRGAAAGSRVLITTRQQSVARQMGAIHLHAVHTLSDEESWSLLCKLVFQEDGGSGDGGQVGDIGQQIAKKCDGLPLAIKTIAGVLRTKSRTRPAWEMVLKDPAWSLVELPDGVMGVLYLSYQELPLELRQCFNFCSLFPEDYLFKREELTQLWVAEGFIAEKGGEDVLLEDVADDYYNELLSRSLLQPIGPDPDSEDEDEYCKMHDLLRSLAQFLAGNEYFVGDVSQLVNATITSSSSSSSSYSMKLRHLFINGAIHHHTLTQVVKGHESLRTLFIKIGGADDTMHMDFLFSKQGCLRVLVLPDVISLPKYVGNLIHLRYLNLSQFDSYFFGSPSVELPETVGNLSNLQYLILNNCKKLKKLPRGIAKLYKLRALDLEETPVDGLPAGIGRLQHLNCLKGFVTNEDEDGGWCSLKELSSLSQLRTLTIVKLERALISFRGEPRPRDFLLKHLRHLRHLMLRCSLDYDKYGDYENQKMIFEVDLFPPPSLETFQIYSYFALDFPSWHLPNLTRLQLDGCRVKSIGPEFMAMGMGVGALAFPMLRRLDLKGMLKLVKWQWEAEDGVVAMPRLEELSLHYCRKLRCLPSGLGSVTTLTTLSIQWSRRLGVIENLHSLKVLKVTNCQNLTRVSNLPALQDMEVEDCNALREVEGLYSLQSLLIRARGEINSLPGWLLLEQGQPAFPMLKSLSIRAGHANVMPLRCLDDGPDWPKIQHYPQVYITAGSLFVRYTNAPFTFTTNVEAD